MNYEQKVEVIYLYAGANYEKILAEKQALGWEVVSSVVNQVELGNQMTVTLRRNKNLKLYKRFQDLDNKVKTLKQIINQEFEDDFKKIEKDKKVLPVLRSLLTIVFVLLVFFDIYIILATITTFNENKWNSETILALIVNLIVVGVGHYLQNKGRVSINKRLNGEYKNQLIEGASNEISNLVREASSLDHSILN